MERRARTRGTLLVCIIAMTILSLSSDASRLAGLALGVPSAVFATLLFVVTTRHELAATPFGKRMTDAMERSTFVAWSDLFIMWSVSAVALAGLGHNALYGTVFVAALVIAMLAALGELMALEEPTPRLAPWQIDPHLS